MNLLNNIRENFLYLQTEFLGFSINLWGIGQFFLHLFIALTVFILFYFLGEKIRKRFFSENTHYNFFINIALGYIVIGTGLGLLGIFSLLESSLIIGYVIGVCIAAFYPFSFKKMKKMNFPPKSFLMLSVYLFIFIAFLRLITPQIAEDGYHTDNAKLFLTSHTTVHPSRDPLHTIPFPHLPEMIYIIPLVLGDIEATRFIHFGFYLLIIAFLFTVVKDKKYSFAVFLPLLFVTNPIVIRNSSTQYTDFFAVFIFLLAVFLIVKNITKKTVMLSGILFGAVVSAKVWMVIYLPALVLYLVILNRKFAVKKLFVMVGIFIGGYLLISSLWYIRAYIISGNPIFPLLNYILINPVPKEVNPLPDIVPTNYFQINLNMFSLENVAGLSPFFLIAIGSFLLVIRQNTKQLVRLPLFVLFVILTLEQLFIPVSWGRYLILWSLIASVFVSLGIFLLYSKNIIYKTGFIAVFFIFFGYYFLNTILLLPYGLGWADKNVYLTRVLGRDNISYYDFNRDFRKWIKQDDLVATYRIGSFYYADFQYIDLGFVLSDKSDSFNKLHQKGVTHLLIKGGNFEWFCNTLELKDCKQDRVKLLATYPKDIQKYNLYLLQY